ncbi:hypothetical protein OUZ56_018728 [Daphnia magna]|uniref:Uncharacterized protein n=1 Tax=Daphnia magna TaxID=35525 RepID=A0ABQ9ZAE1_9CRUS|nr:hypothetical protein OUZ56_018728 [Daphnia magna]
MVPQGMSSKRTELCLSGIWAWSPQIPVRSLSCSVRTFNRSMYETVRILSLSPRKICKKILGQSAGESPQFLLSAVRGPRPHFILAQANHLDSHVGLGPALIGEFFSRFVFPISSKCNQVQDVLFFFLDTNEFSPASVDREQDVDVNVPIDKLVLINFISVH